MAKSNGLLNINVDGCDEIAAALERASAIRYDAVAKTAAQDIYNRGVAHGGTPVRTGELRQSMKIEVEGQGKAVVGYTKEYAPHVEFGHRTVNGGYVPGQHYFQNNIDTERPIYKRMLMENLKKVL